MRSYEHCTLCPRRCGVDRTKGGRGFCGMPDKLYAARASAHYWEEPVISGSFGSGAIFFSGCTLRCAFCQNYTISDEHFGRELTPQALRAAMERLIDEGVQNINLVTPTHFLPSILPALEPKLPVPVVYNCGGYESVETLRRLEGKIDVYLPDFKYSDNALAKRLSAAPDYYETAAAAILEMYRQARDRGRADNARRAAAASGAAGLCGQLSRRARLDRGKFPLRGHPREPHEPVRPDGKGEGHAAARPPHHGDGV